MKLKFWTIIKTLGAFIAWAVVSVSVILIFVNLTGRMEFVGWGNWILGWVNLILYLGLMLKIAHEL